MPRKLRELIRELQRAGFIQRGGKGGHRNYAHPSGIRITISGKPGDDAKPYQEADLMRVVRDAGKEQR
jgi:predicted RNA binding protein YcfA (HicA-like mRNA interferase family)